MGRGIRTYRTKQYRRRRGAPTHHEGRKIGDTDLRVHVLDGGVDDESDKSEGEAEADEREADACQIGGEAEDDQHNGTLVECQFQQPFPRVSPQIGYHLTVTLGATVNKLVLIVS